MGDKTNARTSYKTNELMSVAEAAALKGVHNTSVYRAITRSDLHGVKIGDRWFVTRRSVGGWQPTGRGRKPCRGDPAGDLTAERFGDWTVVGPAPRDQRSQPRWECRCQCGTLRVVREDNLRSGCSRSCGCLGVKGGPPLKHGRYGSPTYNAWRMMIQRCTNPRHPRFADYGGRGITVCERWRSFVAFLTDIGERPSPDLSLDRIDNDGPYEPGNVRWATGSQQRLNQRRKTHRGRKG